LKVNWFRECQKIVKKLGEDRALRAFTPTPSRRTPLAERIRRPIYCREGAQGWLPKMAVASESLVQRENLTAGRSSANPHHSHSMSVLSSAPHWLQCQRAIALSSADQLLVVVVGSVAVDSAAVAPPSGDGCGLPSRLDVGVLPPTRFTAWHSRPNTFNQSTSSLFSYQKYKYLKTIQEAQLSLGKMRYSLYNSCCSTDLQVYLRSMIFSHLKTNMPLPVINSILGPILHRLATIHP